MSESQKMQKALAEFRNPYSCSQTVYAAYAANPDAEELNNLKAMSGGRAPGNLCGALYAAKQLLPEKLSGEVERLSHRQRGRLNALKSSAYIRLRAMRVSKRHARLSKNLAPTKPLIALGI